MKRMISVLAVWCVAFVAFSAQAKESLVDKTPEWWKQATPQMMEDMIKNGADVNENVSGLTALIIASVRSRTDIMNILIKHGADIEARGKYGWTALMWAARFNANPAIIETLIKYGANVKVKDKDGKAALDYAKDNPNIYRTKAYWLLNDKTYE